MTSFENDVVSVLIPVYNASKHLETTIKSALAQTYRSIELVLVDDCSTDNSWEILNEYSNKHPNIACFRLAHNSGAAVARNQALKMAKGRYVAFLDSDDLWYPEKIEKQLGLIKKENAAICFAAIEIIDEKERLLKSKRSIPERVDYSFLLQNTVIATSSVVIDRAKTGAFEMPLIRAGQDYATWLQLLRNGTIAYGINETLVKYRRREKSLSSNKLESVQQVWLIQVRNEGINLTKATFNSIFFAVNAFKKYYL